ncbi:hypothetical protein D9M69_606890 [compost metagenome]
MHVDRCGHIVTIGLHHVGHHLGQQLVPLLGAGHVVDVGQHAFLGPFLDRRTFDLRSRGRVARNGAALEHSHGVFTTTTGHGEILPLVALGFEHALELGGRLRLAARSPVVQHFHRGLGRCGRSGRRRRGGHRRGLFFFAAGGGEQGSDQRGTKGVSELHGLSPLDGLRPGCG